MLEYEKQYVFLYFDSYSKCIPMFFAFGHGQHVWRW